MINWIIIIISFLIWNEAMICLSESLEKYDKRYRIYKSRSKQIISMSQRTKEIQIQYINIKSEIKKFDGNFWINIVYHLITFFIIYTNFKDNVGILPIMIFTVLVISIYSMFAKNKLYFFIKELYLYMFIIIYIIFSIKMPFVINGFELNLIYMLPIFLVVKIIYNNIRKKWQKK